MLDQEYGRRTMLGVVIPTLNAAATLGPTLHAVAAEGERDVDVVVADGGSADATRAMAADRGARIVMAPCGRGVQLAAGAAAAVGDWFLFLHADTLLPRGWRAIVAAFTEDPGMLAAPAIFGTRWTTTARRRDGWRRSSPGAAGGSGSRTATRGS